MSSYRDYALEIARTEACCDVDTFTDWLGSKTLGVSPVNVPPTSAHLDGLPTSSLIAALLECDDRMLPQVRMVLRDRYLESRAEQINARASEIDEALEAA